MARKNNRKSRRRARPKPTERFSWSKTERLQLLAYLSWCAQYCIKFEVTAPGYLERVTGRQFSKERIRGKLYEEWKRWGTCDKFHELFEVGTAGLTPLVGEELEVFHEMFTSISPAQGARCTRSRSLGLAATSGTLSVPRSLYSISSSREPNEVSTPLAGNSNVVPERPRQKRRTKSSLGSARLGSNDDPSEDELARDDDPGRVKSEDESELSRLASSELSSMELQLGPVIPDSQEDAMTVISEAGSNPPMEVRLRLSEAELLKQKSYSVTLENRISELERRNYDLEHCIDNASSSPGNFSGVEVRLRQELAKSKGRLEREGLLMGSYKDLEADRLGFLNTSLRAEYENLYSNIRNTSSTICDLSLDDALPEQRTNFPPLADNWAKRISGYCLGCLLDRCEAAQIPKRFILAATVAAGIFELVLEDVFPAFLAADSPLLDEYRWHIETESYFLPPESRDITQRLSHSDPEKETIEDMNTTLTHVLKFKIELLLSVKRLKYHFFRPGTLFDAEKMKVGQSQAGNIALLGKEVKICLLPALFTFPEASNGNGIGGESDLRASYSKALTETSAKDTESLVLVEKAIVFL
ncbi:uncharacterized protein FTJAE_11637 [Fusarium tjaetaba]|uniref:Uncharacterized protein n=1 Tax=Fusarium tjaetaba TaxID=1567544 RepID=A0A8H5VGT6_9HYPO|nr:uncharacterized protein FTJAE_11637 [Fusarium tjaetaba]KAF5620584.1 hypothetical protein FTJAE_11637 [Fusarium tjaetaba]